jgi:hypothetical protein
MNQFQSRASGDRARKSPIRRNLCRAALAGAAWLLAASPSPAQAPTGNEATTIVGTRLDLVNKVSTYNLTGAGINIGQVEIDRPGDPDVMMAGNPELNHPNVNPGGAGTIGVGVVVAGPMGGAAVFDMNLGNHATQVAGMMISTNANATGTAPGATLYSSATTAGSPIGTGDVAAFEQVRNFGGGTRIINASYGFPPPGGSTNDGNTILPLYIDHTSGQQNVLFVQAGNEDIFIGTPLSRRDTIPADAYNNINVAASSKRSDMPGARYDQISNVNSTNQTADGRQKTDLVAPGASNVEVDLFMTGTNTVTRTIRVFPLPPLAVGESYTNAAGNTVVRNLTATSDPMMTSLFDTNGDGNLNTMNLGGANPLDTTGLAQAGGTSFAAPQVAAAAALLKQRAVNLGLQAQDTHLTEKAVLMNSASKHIMSAIANNPPIGGGPVPPGFYDGQAWAVRYNMRNGDAMGTLSPNAITQPTDPQMGAGQLNLPAMVKQFVGNARSDIGLRQVAVPKHDGGINPGMQSFALDDGNELKKGSLVTATAVWDRVVGNTMPGNLASLRTIGNYNAQALSDIDLQLWNVTTGTQVAWSRATQDNVEHLYVNVPADGKYELRAVNFDVNNDVTTAVAWTSGSTDGLSFSVNRGAEGIMAGSVNDVNSLGLAGPAAFATEGEIFTSGRDGRNMQRLSAALQTLSRVGPHNAPPSALAMLDSSNTTRGVLGLQPGDNLDGLSYGSDGTSGKPSVLAFSVDPTTAGKAGTGVHDQAVVSPALVGPVPTPFPTNPTGGSPGHEAAGDVFKSAMFGKFGRYRSQRLNPAAADSNLQMIDEAELGLQAPSTNGQLLSPVEDDLDAIEFDSPLSVDTDGDGMHNFPVYFTLDGTSPSNPPSNGWFSNIFVSQPSDTNFSFSYNPNNPFSFQVFADGVDDVGLSLTDVIDALALSDVTPVDIPGFADLIPNGMLDAGLDEALFSLAPGSPHGVSGADIFYTDFMRPFDPSKRWHEGGSLFATAAEMGLLDTDNINALDVFFIPEPSSIVLALAAGLMLAGRRRRAV